MRENVKNDSVVSALFAFSANSARNHQPPLCLAPMAGYTNLAFRLSLRELGGLSLATTDLVHVRSLSMLNPKALKLIVTCPEDKPLAVQLFGKKPQEFSSAAKFLEQWGAEIIDLNMGCPARKVNHSGGGAALLKNEELALEIAQSVVEAVSVPVTVKMRLGWDDQSHCAARLAPELEKIGVSAITVHGRTRMQGYSGTADWSGIKRVVDSVQKIPVIGNGDVRTPQDAKRMLTETGCAGVAIGRGALKNPFIFRQTAQFLKTGELPLEPSFNEKLDFIRRHFETSVRLLGEEQACIEFRKVMAQYAGMLPASVRGEWKRRGQKLASADDFSKVCDLILQTP